MNNLCQRIFLPSCISCFNCTNLSWRVNSFPLVAGTTQSAFGRRCTTTPNTTKPTTNTIHDNNHNHNHYNHSNNNIEKCRLSNQQPIRDVDEVIFHLFADNGKLRVLRFIEELKHNGISIAKDARFAKLDTKLTSIIRDNDCICDLETFRDVIKPVLPIVLKALQNKNVIPDFQDFTEQLTHLYNDIKEINDGKNASKIQLSRYEPTKFGLSVCTVDGQRFSIGDCLDKFPIQQIGKVFAYGTAITDYGSQYVHKYVGHEPSPFNINSLKLNNRGIPYNPMIKPGALVTTSLIQTDLEPSDRIGYLMKILSQLSGGDNITIDLPTFISEREQSDRIYALAYFLRENKCFPDNAKLQDVCDLYFQLSSTLVDCEMLSVMAASLANGGTCPITNQRIFSSAAVRDILSMMNSCGLFNFSGRFSFKVGLPAKSSESGVVMTVVPNVMGICSWSPPLDERFNSVRGLAFMEKLTEVYNLHQFDLSKSKINHSDPRIKLSDFEENKTTSLMFAAKYGSLGSLNRYLTAGHDLNAIDYDGRTALHIAAAEGMLSAVKFLIERGEVNLSPIDRWGQTPLQNATLFQHDSVKDYLEERKQK